jgi:hypothetical protein
MPVAVINMIPNTLSGETQRDSEPNVSVNPANPLQIAASAFTPDPAASGSGPIFVSTDGGNTWALNVVLPGGDRTGDVSLRFGSTSNVLYAGILRFDTPLQLNILRSANFTAPGLMTTLVNRANDDQPWVEALTSFGSDRLWVSSNDVSQRTTTGRTATIEQSQNAATAAAPAGIAAARLEVRATASLGAGQGNQDGPSVRSAAHRNGTVYGAYLGWRTFATPNVTDVVVVRDDDFGAGAAPYADLLDSADGLAGQCVVTGRNVAPLNTTLGTQRIGSQLAVAVDPRDSRIVWLAWCDGINAASYTVHLRRSADSGQTWSADLRAITGATNPCLAVNSHGKVGFMYQQLVNPGAGNRWRTHLEVSANAFATAPTDFLLADVPDANGAYAGTNPIGDYANLVALGKNFYGVFSANNTPNNANFPNGVSYQRNANFTTQTLLANDGVTAVAVSIDPFFVRYTDIAAGDDFYVRDWTDSAASGDNGLEPSTHDVFYATSDVWNRRGTLPGPFPNDQPSNENAGNGAGSIGDNWAFARIRRNTAGSAPVTVNAHFLVSKLGTGSSYVDAGTVDPDVSFPAPDPTLNFAAADLGPTVTAAYPWHLAAVSSTHLCLAVEISTPADPFVAPSLVGRAPGWPTTDLAVIDDNNKAQRNMGLSTTPARGVGFADELWAIAHNADIRRRDMVLRIESSPKTLQRLRGARIALARAEGGASLKPGASIVLKDMQPGENRWVGLQFKAPAGRVGETIAVFINEIVDGKAVNGFGLGVRIGSDKDVLRAVLERHRSVFTRIASGHDNSEAKAQAERAAKVAGSDALDPAAYQGFVLKNLDALRKIVHALLRGAGEPFGSAAALSDLERLAAGRSWSDLAAAHRTLLERLDAWLTARQLERGDAADLLQNLRWLARIYSRKPALRALEFAPDLVARTQEFIDAVGGRKAALRDAAKLIESQLADYRATAAALPRLKLEAAIEAMAAAGKDLDALQGAQRRMLLALDRLATR